MHYEITIKGELDGHWSVWFDGLRITKQGNGNATIAGLIADQAALHGILVRIRDLGLPLVSVIPVGTPPHAE
jgi:hypothetical protein